MEYGWRTVVISKGEKISLKENCLHIEKDDCVDIPLYQIRLIIINSNRCTITTALIQECTKKNVSIIFCDEKENPIGEYVPFNNYVSSPGRIIEQINWSASLKGCAWQQIVKQKIKNQILLLEQNHYPVSGKFDAYYERVNIFDTENMEGQAARLYFNTIFGNTFNRRDNNIYNPPLNYGYTILLSLVNRIICSHGYNTVLGINHCSKTNPFNFSCDIMEPFRPIIDDIVLKHDAMELNREYKAELISCINKTIFVDSREMQLSDAMNVFFISVINFLNGKSNCILEVRFAE